MPGYYCIFVPNYSDFTRLLTNLTKKEVAVVVTVPGVSDHQVDCPKYTILLIVLHFHSLLRPYAPAVALHEGYQCVKHSFASGIIAFEVHSGSHNRVLMVVADYLSLDSGICISLLATVCLYTVDNGGLRLVQHLWWL